MGLKEMDSRLSREFIRRIPVYPVTQSIHEINRGKLLDHNQIASIVYRLTFRGCLCEDALGKYCFPWTARSNISLLSLSQAKHIRHFCREYFPGKRKL